MMTMHDDDDGGDDDDADDGREATRSIEDQRAPSNAQVQKQPYTYKKQLTPDRPRCMRLLCRKGLSPY